MLISNLRTRAQTWRESWSYPTLPICTWKWARSHSSGAWRIRATGLSWQQTINISRLQWCSDPNTEQNEPDPHVLKLTSALCSNELQSVLIESPTIHSRFQQIILPPSPLQMGGVLKLIRRQDYPQPPDIILCCRARHLFVFSRSLFICHYLAPTCRASIRPLPPPALCLSARAH